MSVGHVREKKCYSAKCKSCHDVYNEKACHLIKKKEQIFYLGHADLIPATSPVSTSTPAALNIAQCSASAACAARGSTVFVYVVSRMSSTTMSPCSVCWLYNPRFTALVGRVRVERGHRYD